MRFLYLDILQIQGRRNNSDIGEACLTNAKGASVKGESTPLVGGWSGGIPEKILKFMTPVDAF